VRAYGTAARVSLFKAVDLFPHYLQATLTTLDARTRDGRRGIAARRSLLATLAGGDFVSPP
jgi:hypothetical protein